MSLYSWRTRRAEFSYKRVFQKRGLLNALDSTDTSTDLDFEIIATWFNVVSVLLYMANQVRVCDDDVDDDDEHDLMNMT